MFYAAGNNYANETSVGFCNTWYVIGFATRQTRDAYVQRASDLATRAIKHDEMRKYNEQPGAVSHYDAEGFFHQACGEKGQFIATGKQIDPATAKVIESGF